MVLPMQPLSTKKKETAFFAEGSANKWTKRVKVKDEKSKNRPAA